MYDIAIIGAGPGGIFSAYELLKLNKNIKILMIETGNVLEKRKCPIDGVKIKSCINCKPCSIMNGFGGAGAFSDGKYNITNDFGGTLYQYIGKEKAIELMKYVDDINVENGGEKTKLYKNDNSFIKKICIQNGMKLLDAEVRHLGTDVNYIVMGNIYNYLKDKIDIKFNTTCESIEDKNGSYVMHTDKGDYEAKKCIISAGRSGSKWMEKVCKDLNIETKSNRVDIGVRVEVPAEIMEEITDNLYEAKIKYMTKCHKHFVRTFCMNPYGYVVNENVDGIVTVNGHSFAGKEKRSKNTNFALLVSLTFTEPFKEPNKYGKQIASTMNMLAGGDIIVQRFGDLKDGRRTDVSRLKKSTVIPTLKATPGNLGLAMPKDPLEDIIETIEVLNNIAPGISNVDTLLYGLEVKFYSAKPDLTEHLEVKGYKNFYAIGDGAGVTRGLAQAGASGIIAARDIITKIEKLPYVCNNNF